MSTGQLAAQLSMDAALERDEDWSALAWAEIVKLTPGDRITSDILHRRLGSPNGHGDAVGGVLHRAARARLITTTGERLRSERPSARGRRIDVWMRTTT